MYTKDKSVLYNFPCGKNTAFYRVPATVDYICCTAFASAKYLNKLYLDGKEENSSTGNGGNASGNGDSSGAGNNTGNNQPPANEKIKVKKLSIKK
ncbi:MAG: hypothetical protein HDT41_02205 [Lachnospiraceae bacterium]|nr:hypothetical protein [Lachnospiraceae bacterium]